MMVRRRAAQQLSGGAFPFKFPSQAPTRAKARQQDSAPALGASGAQGSVQSECGLRLSGPGHVDHCCSTPAGPGFVSSVV